ncbi:3-oxoacyl-[acyl-carrier-protein] reductase [Caerostris extrusa]|uniref:3-oxoacyl-[acyl-carrier-protein] reductase n=1 Tax=Caerostris extrusa TaxID=172846 RepID=A0AAV4M5V5_CAEEX|nr:3-oxoacyl-[acyl-carrier-protein] reductase [Caerostris extrusa]
MTAFHPIQSTNFPILVAHLCFKEMWRLLPSQHPIRGNTSPSSLGFGGTIVETLLRGIYQSLGCNSDQNLARLVLFPATTHEGVDAVFRFVEGRQDLGNEFFALLNKLSFAPVHLKSHRGFALFQGGHKLASEIKIAFVDLLKYMGITSDKIVGYGIGELASTYSDGCITAEQAILAAYFCGKSIEQVKFRMNGTSVTGFKVPAARSQRWINSSYPEPKNRLANAEYFAHRLISVAPSSEALRQIPQRALVVEVGRTYTTHCKWSISFSPHE